MIWRRQSLIAMLNIHGIFLNLLVLILTFNVFLVSVCLEVTQNAWTQRGQGDVRSLCKDNEERSILNFGGIKLCISSQLFLYLFNWLLIHMKFFSRWKEDGYSWRGGYGSKQKSYVEGQTQVWDAEARAAKPQIRALYKGMRQVHKCNSFLG